MVRQPDPADGRVKRLVLTPDGGELTRRGIRIAADLDEEIFGPGGDPLRETLQNIAARPRAASRPARNQGQERCHQHVPPTGFEPVPPP